jgi:hypothetical protein
MREGRRRETGGAFPVLKELKIDQFKSAEKNINPPHNAPMSFIVQRGYRCANSFFL